MQTQINTKDLPAILELIAKVNPTVIISTTGNDYVTAMTVTLTVTDENFPSVGRFELTLANTDVGVVAEIVNFINPYGSSVTLVGNTINVRCFRIVNTTPHGVNINHGGNTVVVIPPSGVLVRVAVSTLEMPPIGGFRFTKTVTGVVQGLPIMTDGVYLIVSRMALSSADPLRTDLLCVGEILRDAAGVVVGAIGFSV